MTYKPEIQYVGQFYVHGSEARQVALEQPRKKAKTKLPAARIRNMEKLYVDPVALVGIVVAVVMLVVMIIGTVQIWNDWQEYKAVSAYVSDLHYENVQLSRQYRSGYDLDEIKMKALALGMVPVSEVQTVTLPVTMPEPEPETSFVENIVWFLEGLFA